MGSKKSASTKIFLSSFYDFNIVGQANKNVNNIYNKKIFNRQLSFSITLGINFQELNPHLLAETHLITEF